MLTNSRKVVGRAPVFKLQMPDDQQKIWIKIRAELIVHFHDRMNPNKFEGSFSFEYAVHMAKNQLHYDLIMGELRITLEQMLLHTNDECLEILEAYKKRCFNEMLERNSFKRKSEQDCD